MDSKIQPKRSSKKKKILEFIIDETAVKAGSEMIWLVVVIKPNDKEILAVDISKERNMFIAEQFLSAVVQKYGMNSVLSDIGTWYPQACKFLNITTLA